MLCLLCWAGTYFSSSNLSKKQAVLVWPMSPSWHLTPSFWFITVLCILNFRLVCKFKQVLTDTSVSTRNSCWLGHMVQNSFSAFIWPRSACWILAEIGWKTLFLLKCCERKILFRLKKEAEQARYGVSRTGPTPAWRHGFGQKLRKNASYQIWWQIHDQSGCVFPIGKTIGGS